jgi:rhodanese-related sulfurtransferase
VAPDRGRASGASRRTGAEQRPRIDPTRPIAVICAGGIPSATASSLLRLHRARDVVHVVDGGVPTLAARGVALVADADADVEAVSSS